MKPLASTRLSTPLGDIIVLANEGGLLFAGFHDQPKLKKQASAFIKDVAIDPSNEHIQNFDQELAAYFAGKLQTFTTPCVWSRGTPFQQRTWQMLERIPYGKTVSYAQVAASMHHPTAYRAVALANGANPFVIRVPCHRVIKSNGNLCGYNAGLHRKEWLLQHEKQYAI